MRRHQKPLILSCTKSAYLTERVINRMPNSAMLMIIIITVIVTSNGRLFEKNYQFFSAREF